MIMKDNPDSLQNEMLAASEKSQPEVLAAPEKRSWKRRSGWLMLFLAFLIPLVWMAILRTSAFSVGENSQDGLYHAGMAEMGPSVYMAKKFPWTQMSAWRDHFADKELLYHASMDLIFRIERLFGVGIAPPFHFAAMFYMALALAGFVFAARQLGVRPQFILAGSVLFCLMSPGFTFRFSLLRPHVLSLACLMTVCGLMCFKSFKTRILSISILSFFFAWTYSNPHFIVIVPLFFAACQAPFRGKRELLIPLASLGAVLLGLLIHPQFPNSFIIWKIQSWDALISPMMKDANLSLPSEMMPASFGYNKLTLPLYVLAWCSLARLIRIIEKVGIARTDANLYALCLLSAMFTCGIWIAVRSIEYAQPFVTLWVLLLAERSMECGVKLPFGKFKHGYTIFLAVISVAFALESSRKFMRDCPQTITPRLKEIPAFLKEHVPAGEAVVNIDWSDFPMVFYYDRDHLWQWGMDPVFSYMVEPQKTMILTKTRPNHGGETYPMDIYRAFGTKYAVILWPRVPHASLLFSQGWKIEKSFIEEGKEEGWIFSLDERTRIPKPFPADSKVQEKAEKQQELQESAPS